MIITITLNPALDKTVEIDNFRAGAVNRIKSLRMDAAGKGINVSKVIKVLGGESKAFGILAGNTGQFINSYLDTEAIENDFVFVSGDTRTNLKIIDKQNNQNTDINEMGPEVFEEEIKMVEEKLFRSISKMDTVIFSGSIPQGVPATIYAKWIEMANALGAKTILDADNEMFKEGIKKQPYLVKPNIHELERLFQTTIKSEEELLTYARKLLNMGISFVVVSLGKDGALFMTKESAAIAKGLEVEVISTVGAGDSMVAALSFALEQKKDFQSLIRLAVATGTANVMTSGSQPANKDIIQSLLSKVILKTLY